jgi:hypothetical protein
MALPLGLRCDIVVAGAIILEIKAVAAIVPAHEAQVLTYLRMSGIRLEFLVNFPAPRLKDGLKRVIVCPTLRASLMVLGVLCGEIRRSLDRFVRAGRSDRTCKASKQPSSAIRAKKRDQMAAPSGLRIRRPFGALRGAVARRPARAALPAFAPAPARSGD